MAVAKVPGDAVYQVMTAGGFLFLLLLWTCGCFLMEQSQVCGVFVEVEDVFSVMKKLGGVFVAKKVFCV